MLADYKPLLYLKQNCPFCLKVRIFLLEADMADAVVVVDFKAGTPEEALVREKLAPRLEKVTFPAAEIEPDVLIADSDEIIASLARRADIDPATLTTYQNYIEGPFATMMSLWRENRDLKAAAVAS